ncbi:MAG: hypothetical protein JWO03_97 [Bacteroidetes bacterium]|nr:hypothetical protein [Bacteroidota bacterium]
MTNTSKALFSALLIISSLALLSAAGDGKFKLWDTNNKLTWDDYRDTVLVNSRRGALTSSGMHMSYKMSDDEVIVEAYSQMDPTKSWADSAKKSDRLLSHEQYHFNITEYWCRKFKKDISSAHFSMKNFKEKIADIQKGNAAESKEMQTLYDTETKHSIAKEEQKKWEAKIDDLLKKTEAFSDKSVSLTLKVN